MKVFIIGGTTVANSDSHYVEEFEILKQAMRRLGKDLIDAGHDLLVCSPFPGSADVEAVCGAADSLNTDRRSATIEFHYPDSSTICSELMQLKDHLSLRGIQLFPCPPPPDEDSMEARMYAWVLAQLSAMNRSSSVIAVGGRPTSSANLLLLLAEAQRKTVLPLTFLGGAAAESFQRRRYELEDRLGDRLAALNDFNRIGEAVSLVEAIAVSHSIKSRTTSPNFFISYARSRPQEADFVEMCLRRRNFTVFRDEQDFGAGHSIPGEIREHIYKSDIFVAIWCQEYACSPWCYDELELALQRHQDSGLTLWLLCVDDTRIVPPAARNLTNYPTRTREELEGRVLRLLEQIESS